MQLIIKIDLDKFSDVDAIRNVLAKLANMLPNPKEASEQYTTLHDCNEARIGSAEIVA